MPDDLLALLQRSVELAKRGELRGAIAAAAPARISRKDAKIAKAKWPPLPDRLYGSPSDPCEPRPKQVPAWAQRADPARLAAEIARERWWGIDPEREVWRFSEIRRRARSRARERKERP
jgi:hypothetical protein